jgi:hypothetical protein
MAELIKYYGGITSLQIQHNAATTIQAAVRGMIERKLVAKIFKQRAEAMPSMRLSTVSEKMHVHDKNGADGGGFLDAAIAEDEGGTEEGPSIPQAAPAADPVEVGVGKKGPAEWGLETLER